MRLLDALRILRQVEAELPPWPVFFACGFTPLHLETLLTAELQQRVPAGKIVVQTGLYGDLLGNLGRMAASDSALGAVVLEWADLDPRLGLRRGGYWTGADLAGIGAEIEAFLARAEPPLLAAASRFPVAVALPSLPFPLLAPLGPRAVSPFQADVELALAAWRQRLVAGGCWLTPAQAAGDGAADPAAQIEFDFPYTLPHAARLATALAAALAPPPAKKGLITDLDHTLWSGILGDDGLDGVQWDLDHRARAHGVYQQLLHALAQEGVLVATASKNDPRLVAEAFARRSDLILRADDIFPMVAGWQPKSEQIAEILRAWNIGPDAVVFVDDNPFELEEVSRAYPQIECIRFQPQPRALVQLWRDLRERFARAGVGEEDRLRSASLRGAERAAQAAQGADPEEFLRSLGAELQFEHSARDDERALELLNKTNQFNLNGLRLAAADFRRYLAQAGAFVQTTGYTDKFGPLGKISVLLGRCCGEVVEVDFWAMSCRAFARRIEFASLRQLFDTTGAAVVRLGYCKTDRNQPLAEFLQSLPLASEGDRLCLSREAFLARCPVLPHAITAAAPAARAVHAHD